MAVKIDYRRCNGCKKCYNICPMDVFTWDEDTKMPVIEYWDECWHCGICFMECPKRAINVTLPVSLI